MNQIRRSAIEMTNGSFENCIVAANAKIETSLTSMGITGDALNGVSTSVGAQAFPDHKYLEKTMFLNSYLICRLNTELHTKTFGLDNQNGFDLYRQICQLVDSIPEDAAFHLSNELGHPTSLHGCKVHGSQDVVPVQVALKT